MTTLIRGFATARTRNPRSAIRPPAHVTRPRPRRHRAAAVLPAQGTGGLHLLPARGTDDPARVHPGRSDGPGGCHVRAAAGGRDDRLRHRLDLVQQHRDRRRGRPGNRGAQTPSRHADAVGVLLHRQDGAGRGVQPGADRADGRGRDAALRAEAAVRPGEVADAAVGVRARHRLVHAARHRDQLAGEVARTAPSRSSRCCTWCCSSSPACSSRRSRTCRRLWWTSRRSSR